MSTPGRLINKGPCLSLHPSSAQGESPRGRKGFPDLTNKANK
jgi:hypothetical protein